MFVASRAGNVAVFSTADGQNRTAVQKTNGYFSIKADWMHEYGKYKVELYNKRAKCSSQNLIECLGNKLDEKYFNKGNLGQYYSYYLDFGDSSSCGGTISSVLPLNRSFSLSSSTSTNCGHIVSLNQVPIYRSWGKNFNPTINNLAINRAYRYQVYFASNINKQAKKTGSVTTTSFPAFKIISSQSFGEPSNGTFYQRFTFNQAYKPESLNLVLTDLMSNFDRDNTIAFQIRQVNPSTFDLIPNHAYNNDTYFVDGVSWIKDLHGNPLVGFSYDFEIFETALNPASLEAPKFSLEKDNYLPSDKIRVDLNFSSVDLSSKLEKILLYNECVSEECNGPLNNKVEISVSVEGRQIVISPSTSLLSGSHYRIYLPDVVDDNNNIVSQEKSYSFVVN